MKSLVRLPVFYLSLVFFAVMLVLFEDRQETLDWRRPSSSVFRLPKIHSSITFNETASGGYTPGGTSDDLNATEPTQTHNATLAATTAVTGQRSEAVKGDGDLPLKSILVWTFGYGLKTMGFGEGQTPFKTAGCEVDACHLTGNRTLLPLTQYDAIIFHFRSLKHDELPATRSPQQRWVFWEVESASYVYQDPGIYNGLFNWTMTYRLDSDVQQRYGRVYPVSNSSTPVLLPSPSGEGRNYASGKTKLAAWFVSNCHTFSRRENIVQFMKRSIKVDVFGKCGKLHCPREREKECNDMLSQHYKFYLSFENSLCKDYVTEKLFSILRYDVVPVVFGLANYTSIAPPHSFINVIDFPTVKSLVKYLKYLDSNDTAYSEYFKWKGHYHVERGWNNTARSFCDLCKKLHQDQTPKVYKNMREWFVKQGSCKKLDLTSG